MSIYQRYCTEVTDGSGGLKSIELHYPPDFNFGYDVVDRIAQETPDKRALVWCNEEREEHVFTFSQIREESSRMADVFRRSGIGRGDRVLLVLKRHYEYWFAVIALHKLGAVAIPATHMLTVPDLAYRMRASQAKAVVCTPRDGVPERILSALETMDRRVRLWCVQEDREGFANLTRQAQSASPFLERIPTRVTDPMLLYFTSGTTGHPKGVIHDHAYPLAHIVTAKYWQQAEEGGLHFTVAETGWAKAPRRPGVSCTASGWWGAPLWCMISTILSPERLRL